MTTNPEAGMRLEDAAQALFRRAQGIYREDHDHFPLKHSWETLNEKLRDGWRSMARVAIEAAAPVAPAGSEGEVEHAIKAIERFRDYGFERWNVGRALDVLTEALAARAKPPGGEARCQACGGEVQGWMCQSCDATFTENDDGYLIIHHPAEPVARDWGEAARLREGLEEIICWFGEAPHTFPDWKTTAEALADMAQNVLDGRPALSSPPASGEK